MRFLARPSLKRSLLMINGVTTSITLLLIALFYAGYWVRDARTSLAMQLTAAAKIVSANSTAALLFGDQKSAEEVLSALSALPDVVDAVILTSEGREFARFTGKSGQRAVAGLPLQDDGTRVGPGYLSVVERIVIEGDWVGTLVLRYSLKRHYADVVLHILMVALIMVLGVILSSLFAARLHHSISRPVENLAHLMKRISQEGNYSVCAVVEGQEEIRLLGKGFNEMLLQIQERDRELAIYRTHLEEEVAQRTRELTLANERLSRKTEELNTTNEELKNFAYIVSHDLRAPLVNIRGFAAELARSVREMEPLVEDCLPGASSHVRERLEEIMRTDVPEAITFIDGSVKRMDNLIGHILTLSRIGRRDLTFEPVDADALVKFILESLAHQIERHSICIEIEELPVVVADRTAMEQILGNLIDNAVKYLVPGRHAEIRIRGEKNSHETVYHVSDNGRGIAKEDFQKIFEVFRRAGKQDVPGEGMGLAHVKALVQRHGGRIWCTSELGEGSTFSFSVRHDLQAAPTPATSDAS